MASVETKIPTDGMYPFLIVDASGINIMAASMWPTGTTKIAVSYPGMQSGFDSTYNVPGDITIGVPSELMIDPFVVTIQALNASGYPLGLYTVEIKEL